MRAASCPLHPSNACTSAGSGRAPRLAPAAAGAAPGSSPSNSYRPTSGPLRIDAGPRSILPPPRLECRRERAEVGQRRGGREARPGRCRAPHDERLPGPPGGTRVDVAVHLDGLRARQLLAHLARLLEAQQRPRVRFARDHQVVHEDVALALVQSGAGGGVPAEEVAARDALVALERRRRVHEGVVVNARARGVQHAQPLVAPHEQIARHRHAARDLEEEAVDRPLDPVVHEDAVAVAHVIPDPVRVGVVDDQVVAAGDAVRLVEDLHRRRVVPRQLLDVVAPEDVLLEQDVGRADDVNPLGRRVAEERLADRQLVAAEVAGHPRAERHGHVLERRPNHFLPVGGRVGGAHRLVGRFLGRRRGAGLPLDLERAEGVLREGEAADGRPPAIGLLAVHRARPPDEREVEGGDLDAVVLRIEADVDVARVVVDEVPVRADLPLPAGRLQHPAVHEHHVVVESVQRRAHSLAGALPPPQRFGREQRLPGRPPQVVAQRLPLVRHARPLQDGALVAVRLQRDPLVQLEAAGTVHPASHDDGVAGHDTRHGRLDCRRLLEGRAGGVRAAVRGDVVHVRGLRDLVDLLDRAVRPARGLRGAGRGSGEKEQGGSWKSGRAHRMSFRRRWNGRRAREQAHYTRPCRKGDKASALDRIGLAPWHHSLYHVWL